MAVKPWGSTEEYEQVSRLANVLKDRGIAKGNRAWLYMPMIPETVFAMLACAGPHDPWQP